jgi:hypothetical protein
MRLRIEAPAELTPEEAAAVRAALERYAAATGGPAPAGGEQGRWTRTGREETIRGRPVRPGGRAAWQEARDRRRGASTDGPA